MKSNASESRVIPVIRVTAGIIIRDDRVLLAKRAKFAQLAGLWEFPGGKIEDGESPVRCLARELAEELHIRINPGEVCRFDDSFYEYGCRRILLIGMTVRGYTGVPEAVEHAEIRWVRAESLEALPLAPADVPLARRLSRRGLLRPRLPHTLRL